MTRHRCIDRLRASAREAPSEDAVEEAEVDAEELERLAEALTVRHALTTLPDYCQDMLDRFFARDQTYEVIGVELSIPPGTIASRISRCLGKLRTALGVT